ncbi:MAG: type 4a pilus biogenesis protein PilO [Phycisphaerae bacterium]|nr:type 4a pilus biogenesis protein PilO [Phycisphaerae bacterium]
MSKADSKPLHRKEQIWVCVVAGLFLCDFVVCGWLPSRQRLTSLQQARSEQRRTIDLAAAQGVEVARLKAKLRDTERLVERFDASVPPERMLGNFLQQMGAVMAQCELTNPMVLPGKELESGDLGCIPVQVACTGTLPQLFSFFGQLRTLDRRVRIGQVMVENDAAFTGQLRMQAEVVIFYQSSRFRAETAAPLPLVEEVNRGA